MRSRAEYAALLNNRNVIGTLMAIRSGESSLTDDAFFMRWGGTGQPPKRFDDLSRHPRILEPGPNGPSSAAGALQITMSTYDEFAPKLGITDFSRESQLIIGLAIMDHEGALEHVLAGDVYAAVELLGGRWASLPSSKYGQRTMRFQTFMSIYKKYGGLDGRAAAPIEEVDLSGLPPREEQTEEVKDDMDPVTIGLGISLLKSVFDVFSPLAAQKAEKALAKHTDTATAKEITENLLSKIKEVGGSEDQIAAVAAVRADAKKIAEVEDYTIAKFDEWAPLLDKLEQFDRNKLADEDASRDAASRRAVAENDGQDELLTRSIVNLMTGVAVALGSGVLILMILDKPFGELMALFGGVVGVIIGKFGTRVDYRYGSSRQSGAKDASIELLTRGRR